MQAISLLNPPNGVEHNHSLTVVPKNEEASKKPSFIEANTEEVPLSELRSKHIIPTYKDATPLISHADFISVAEEVTHRIFSPERILAPQIRVSHPILGRIPEAKDKKASELLEQEKTVYYERMAFLLEVASITDTIGGHQVAMTIGGVRKYDGSSLRSGAEQQFKLFAGYQVKVCCNLCVWSDGVVQDLKVRSLKQLEEAIYQLLCHYDAVSQLTRMEEMMKYSLTEQQFAHLIGKGRIYQHLPPSRKALQPPFLFSDFQLNQVCREYVSDAYFSGELNGEVSLWKLYNLFTSANKSSYIDHFLPRAANASTFIQSLAQALEKGSSHWFLS